MNKKDLQKFKKLLLKEREKLTKEMKHIQQDSLGKSHKEATGDLSSYTYHMADMATDNYGIDFSLDRVSTEQKLLYLIDEALARIEDGTYGDCEQCKKKIAHERLEAVSHAILCIDCQSKEEK
jgi:RNA polymerase-binding protein DksA